MPMNQQFNSRASSAGISGGRFGGCVCPSRSISDLNAVLENLDSLEPFLQCLDRPRHLCRVRRVDPEAGKHGWNRWIVSLAAVRCSPKFDDQERTELRRQCFDDFANEFRESQHGVQDSRKRSCKKLRL